MLGVTDVTSSGKSDPYVSVKLGLQQHMKTEVKNRTLNPRYGETFDLLVYERSVEVRERRRDGSTLLDLISALGFESWN